MVRGVSSFRRKQGYFGKRGPYFDYSVFCFHSFISRAPALSPSFVSEVSCLGSPPEPPNLVSSLEFYCFGDIVYCSRSPGSTKGKTVKVWLKSDSFPFDFDMEGLYYSPLFQIKVNSDLGASFDGRSEVEISEVNMVGALLVGRQEGLAKKVQVPGEGGRMFLRAAAQGCFVRLRMKNHSGRKSKPKPRVP